MALVLVNEFKINGIEVGVKGNQNQDGLSCYTVSDCILEKKLLQPNEFRFTLHRDQVGRTQHTIKFDLASNLLAKTVKCKVTTSMKGDFVTTYNVEFEGVIVSAAMEYGDIVCVALSEDYELSIIPHCNYFIDKTLKEIVESIWKKADKRIINPRFEKKIPYVVQYNETDYDFLVRLAKRYGEFFFFDKLYGLVFGKIPDFDTDKGLKRLDDFLNVRYELGSNDPNHAYVASHYAQQGVIRSNVANYSGGSDLYAKCFDASTDPDANNVKLFYDYPNLLPYDATNDYLNKKGELWRESEAANFVVCRCTTYRLDLHVGSKIKFIEKAEGHDFNNGYMIVTSVRLSWDCHGSPINEITAMGIPNGDVNHVFPPYVDVNAYPRSSAQRAIVVDNIDPLKLGRVMVRFAWQDVGEANYAAPDNEDERKKYPWIRIAQPYGGNGKGCYILPEIGEEVMVGFEHNNMEKPFVIGTLYHDSATDVEKQVPDNKWVEKKGDDKLKGNEVKAFRTKNGHTIEFHDTNQGDGFIRIYGKEDKKPNYDIILSTDVVKKQNGDQKEEYPLKCADENAETGKDIQEKDDYKIDKLRIMVQSYGGDIMLDAGEGDIIMNAKNIRIHATGNATTLIEGKNVMKVKDAQLADVGSNSLLVQKDQTIDVKGKDTEKYAKEVSVDTSDAFKLHAKTLSSQTDQKTEVKATSDIDVNANGSVKMKATSGLDLDGGSSAKLQAASVSVEAKMSAALKGTEVSVEGNASTTVKANASLTLQTAQGSRSGIWNDQ